MDRVMNWREDAEWKVRFDDKLKGRRANIWHLEGYENLPRDSYQWRVNDEDCLLGFGEEKTKQAAVRAVTKLVTKLGWIKGPAAVRRRDVGTNNQKRSKRQ